MFTQNVMETIMNNSYRVSEISESRCIEIKEDSI